VTLSPVTFCLRSLWLWVLWLSVHLPKQTVHSITEIFRDTVNWSRWVLNSSLVLVIPQCLQTITKNPLVALITFYLGLINILSYKNLWFCWRYICNFSFYLNHEKFCPGTFFLYACLPSHLDVHVHIKCMTLSYRVVGVENGGGGKVQLDYTFRCTCTNQDYDWYIEL
jgi:hypothetical protein